MATTTGKLGAQSYEGGGQDLSDVLTLQAKLATLLLSLKSVKLTRG